MKTSELNKEIEVLEHNISVAQTLPPSDNTLALLETLQTVKKKIVAGNIGRKMRDTIIVFLPLLYLQIWKLKKL
ncbi:MAG: hypothetical protein A2W82_05395 [Sulfurimonas sp. RIFCSPLOWO2_12_36_12]|uniref:hypothetical protein n=1 Tax=Sulfurimonas sp. RIFCSPLOWO2_12_36_12 TaxID=1802253 RepID=UPI0008BDD2FE|nr:hypothetical protein [Sulfurimonas sp. RIFCSPLOWO2_12_36_12]OHD99639.1 MAG: hypothetical protein A3J26_07945 [Sulfurimonas sp. RIFCSPLOWO2_02_FULL_36_28]OHE01364.1 MAG: hypothetical protein A2W82_05395 [Sulfurimonas sp. RIFCSPLOWO2_12_36_12]